MHFSPHIVVVDDDPEIRKLLGRYLDGQGYRVQVAANAHEMWDRINSNAIDLVVLDVMLPDGSGLDLCRKIHAERPGLSVIILTALKEDVDRIIGLEIGADDYIGKPFNPRELVARIRAVLRRVGNDLMPAALYHRFAGLTADPATRRVVNESGREIFLTGAEFDLLLTFLDRPGRVLSRDQLLDLGRGKSSDPFDRSIDVLVSRLRRKMDEAGKPNLIKTVRNGGYQLVVSVETERGGS